MQSDRSDIALSTVYLIVCGAGPATRAYEFVDHARVRGWDCHVIATDAGARFIDRERLETATSHPVITSHREPGTPRRDRPAADVVVIAPATANTIGKLAAGIADTYALAIASECIGLGVPLVVVPFANTALTGRAPYHRAVASLAAEGVRVLDVPEHRPREGAAHVAVFPWVRAFETAAAMAASA
ncbi:flavoprotein [Glycomyces sp. A-F 0318]|uniref:flavoprotein n=1 Tax=Glycomyces amatae TaxID=2881355 RepID=UPI001E4BFA56|nr:flavoprotein [Glycomyces amatae]MCD0446315.1 flavoprotein [Glycomyces amatae]